MSNSRKSRLGMFIDNYGFGEEEFSTVGVLVENVLASTDWVSLRWFS